MTGFAMQPVNPHPIPDYAAYMLPKNDVALGPLTHWSRPAADANLRGWLLPTPLVLPEQAVARPVNSPAFPCRKRSPLLFA